jgi:hypothetical protein
MSKTGKAEPAAKNLPAARDRTVDMFTGQTNVEAATEHVLDTPKGSETIEQASERWSKTAFDTAQWLSKHWDDAIEAGGSKFRLTEKGDLLLLERLRMDESGRVACQWTGVMFRSDDLYELTNVLLQASKSKRDRERGV